MPQIELISRDSLALPLAELIELAPMPGLDGTPHCAETARRVVKVSHELNLRGSLQEAGLWLLCGELEKSHAISQACDSEDGSFWHGVMHRREGDYWNAKYWFRRVHYHPVLIDLTKLFERFQADSQKFAFATDALMDVTTQPAAYIDLVEQAVTQGRGEWIAGLQQVAWWEWQLLFARSQFATRTGSS